MKDIKVTMKDDFTEELVERTIDISNFSIRDAQYNVERQREILLDWIEERANHQHATSLSLVSWYIV